MNVDPPSAGSVSTRNDVKAKAAKTTTKNQSRGRAERGRGAMLGAHSTVKAKMLFGLLRCATAPGHAWASSARHGDLKVAATRSQLKSPPRPSLFAPRGGLTRSTTCSIAGDSGPAQVLEQAPCPYADRRGGGWGPSPAQRPRCRLGNGFPRPSHR